MTQGVQGVGMLGAAIPFVRLNHSLEVGLRRGQLADETLERTSDQTGALSARTLPELAAYDAIVLANAADNERRRGRWAEAEATAASTRSRASASSSARASSRPRA